jgi:hypothetical protein
MKRVMENFITRVNEIFGIGDLAGKVVHPKLNSGKESVTIAECGMRNAECGVGRARHSVRAVFVAC